MMLSPENPFVLLLRYLVLAALAGLAVRKVTNYRTLFVTPDKDTVEHLRRKA